MADGHAHVILLAGPTASGKSSAALQIAEQVGGVIVNADSMQVYRDLRVLTSRPSAEDEARVPHRLYGHVDGAEPYSVGRWLADVEALLCEAATAFPEKPLIFVGGTGLFFEALTEGISPVPSVPESIRAHWRQRGLEAPARELHAELARRDPLMAARLRPSDPQRVIRALEVLDATGRSLAEWQERAGTPLVDPATATRIVMMPDRAELRARIARRFERMVEDGALEEVRALANRGLDPALPVMKAIGVSVLSAQLRGELPVDEAIGQAITATHQYAKRQSTWFRNRFGAWEQVTCAEQLGRMPFLRA